MNAESAPRTVLVSGASGYIAGWIVKNLLDAGHTVHATVRDPQRASSVAHLLRLAEGAPGTLKLFRADLLEAGSFDAAMQGCEIVFHTASPFLLLDAVRDPQQDLVRPAVEGTRNVLAAVERCASVRRVVLTSSVAAIYGDNRDAQARPGGVLTEADWNTTSSLEHNPYSYSKVAAERAAWEAQKAGRGWELVVVNPAMVLGPSLTPGSRSGSIDVLRQMGDGRGRTGFPDLRFGVVDVRDVADAHVQAAFRPEAAGRYILCERVMGMMDIARVLARQHGRRYPFPVMTVPKAVAWVIGPLVGPVTRRFISLNVGIPLALDNRRSREELGIAYRPIETALLEHFAQIVDDGLLTRKAA